MNEYGETRYREKNLDYQTEILFLENGNRVRWETLNRLEPGRKLGVATWVSSTDSKLRPRRTARRALSGASGQQLWWASICMLPVGPFLWFGLQILSTRICLAKFLWRSLPREISPFALPAAWAMYDGSGRFLRIGAFRSYKNLNKIVAISIEG